MYGCAILDSLDPVLLLQNSMGGWADFLGDMQRFYGVSLECLNDEFRQEQQEYFMSTSAWADVHPSQLMGPPACFKQYDLLTVTLEEIAAPLQVIIDKTNELTK